MTSDDSWRRQGLCGQVGGDFFFPEKRGETRQAKRICEGCPVKVTCWDWAVEHQQVYGVWGGASEQELREEIARRSTTRPSR